MTAFAIKVNAKNLKSAVTFKYELTRVKFSINLWNFCHHERVLVALRASITIIVSLGHHKAIDSRNQTIKIVAFLEDW